MLARVRAYRVRTRFESNDKKLVPPAPEIWYVPKTTPGKTNRGSYTGNYAGDSSGLTIKPPLCAPGKLKKKPTRRTTLSKAGFRRIKDCRKHGLIRTVVKRNTNTDITKGILSAFIAPITLKTKHHPYSWRVACCTDKNEIRKN